MVYVKGGGRRDGGKERGGGGVERKIEYVYIYHIYIWSERDIERYRYI